MSCDAGWWRSKAARLSETRMQEGTMHRLWNRIDFAFSSAWQNFWRNAAVSIASVLIVWVVLLALGSLLLVLHSLDQIVALEKTKASAISVYLADTTPLSSAMDFKLHLENDPRVTDRSEEHTSELQSPDTISYAVFCLKKKKRRVAVYLAYLQLAVTRWR